MGIIRVCENKKSTNCRQKNAGVFVKVLFHIPLPPLSKRFINLYANFVIDKACTKEQIAIIDDSNNIPVATIKIESHFNNG